MEKIKTQEIHKPWITKVEREIDEIRDKISQEIKKVGWERYWGEAREELKSKGYRLTG